MPRTSTRISPGHTALQKVIPPGFPGVYPLAFGRARGKNRGMPFANADASLLLLAESGGGLLTCAGQNYECQGGCFFALQDAAAVRIYALDALVYSYALLERNSASAWLEYIGDYHVLTPEDPGARLFDAYLHFLSAEQRDLPSLSNASYQLLNALAETFAGRVQRQGLVEDALVLIKKATASLQGLDDLCTRLSVSKGHLIRVFQKSLGCSPWQYIQRLRLEDAQLLLLHRDYSMDIVANLVGFANANYFCKAFRKANGISPAAFRTRHAGVSAPGLSALQRLRDIERFTHL